MTKTVLIIGASGNIGSEVITQLSASNNADLTLRAVSRSAKDNTYDLSMNGQKIEQVGMDYNKQESIVKALKNVDKIFLLTPTDPKMVEYTSNLVNEAKTIGQVKHIVKLSHIQADSEPKITITKLHRQAEEIIEDSRISFTFLRPNFFMQNFVNIYGAMIKNQGSFYLSAGDGKASFVDIRDIASVAAKTLSFEVKNDVHVGKAYNITGPEPLSYADCAEILSKQLGKRISYTNVPEEEMRKFAKGIGMNDWHINVILELLKMTRDGYLSNVSSEVEEVLGRNPISFLQFTRDYTKAFE
jgi:uncharacterized protein YbjT (DUF2867 family)